MNTNAVNPKPGSMAGVAAGLAGLLLIPEDGSEVSIAGSLIKSLRSRSR